MHQVRFWGLYHHRDSSDPKTTNDEELLTTLPQQPQSTTPNVVVVLAPRPSTNDTEPIPANSLSAHGEHAEPVRDDDTHCALVLHRRPCHAHQEAPKQQHLNHQAALPHCICAPPVLP